MSEFLIFREKRMSSKLRMDEIVFDDELEGRFNSNYTETHTRRKPVKSKRKKQDSENYIYERSMKRNAADQFENR
jgi:hypothetical protein|tara:strand:+ start:27533 stop:27757 length:225 start_codon:yes stop_codon:yes gene_type:complete